MKKTVEALPYVVFGEENEAVQAFTCVCMLFPRGTAKYLQFAYSDKWRSLHSIHGLS